MQRGRFNLLTLLTLMICLVMTAPVMGGEGNGGGGQGNPLELVSSVPADGDEGVALDTEVRLTFSKNVVNMAVNESNQKCFSVYANNEPIEVQVVMADDQIEPEFKRDIVLVPGEGLKPDTDYTIQIAPELQSKSGTALANAMEINFSTGVGERTGNTNTSSDSDTNNNSEQNADTGGNNTVTVLVVIAVLAAGGLLYAYIRKKD